MQQGMFTANSPGSAILHPLPMVGLFGLVLAGALHLAPVVVEPRGAL
jgi:hypothetical protein